MAGGWATFESCLATGDTIQLDQPFIVERKEVDRLIPELGKTTTELD
ncbi:MAG: hypothetical protein UMU75_07620 [Halomonas sp.]|nr:hypothetical protein [Halomonas sp.]